MAVEEMPTLALRATYSGFLKFLILVAVHLAPRLPGSRGLTSTTVTESQASDAVVNQDVVASRTV